MSNGEMGRGTGSLYETLEIRDGETASELIAKLLKSNGEMGRGTGSLYETLEIRDGETASELIAKLLKFPSSAKIHIGAVERVDASRVRVPVVVRQGAIPLDVGLAKQD